MTAPRVILFDWHGEPLAHEYETLSTRYVPAWQIAEAYAASGVVPAAGPRRVQAPPLILPQKPPEPVRRRRVLLTQGETRPHIDTGLHWGEPKRAVGE